MRMFRDLEDWDMQNMCYEYYKVYTVFFVLSVARALHLDIKMHNSSIHLNACTTSTWFLFI